MSKPFGTSIDLKKNELQNARIQNLAAAPSGPVAGQIYYDTTQNALYWYQASSTSWIPASGGTPSGTAGGDLTGNFPNPTIAAGAVGTTKLADGAVTGGPAGAGVKIAAATITAANIAAAAGILKSQLAALGIVNADVDAAAAIARSKLDFGSGLVNADLSASAAIARSKLDFGSGLVNADISSSAAIAQSKLALSIADAQVAVGAAIARTKIANPVADVSNGGFKLTNLADPVSSTDAATKQYVDNYVQGLDFKPSVRVASTANMTLTAASAGNAIDGVTLAVGDRILLKNQTTAAENGIYTVNANGVAPSRGLASNQNGELSVGTLTFVEAGAANGGQQWVVTAATAVPWVPNSTGTTWTQFSGASATTAGNGMAAAGNVFNIGAGLGIQVNADTVQIDTSVVTRKYATTVGDGTSTSLTVTHNLGTQDVQVTVYTVASPFEEWMCDVEHTSVNVVTLRFAAAPTAGQFRCVVQG